MSKQSEIKLAGKHIPLPASRAARIAIGVALVAGGILGFLPILGFWMVPLGLLVLSYDLPWARRFRRRADVWVQRRRNAMSRKTHASPEKTHAASERSDARK